MRPGLSIKLWTCCLTNGIAVDLEEMKATETSQMLQKKALVKTKNIRIRYKSSLETSVATRMLDTAALKVCLTLRASAVPAGVILGPATLHMRTE